MEAKETKMWKRIYGMKNDLVAKVKEAIGDRTLDLSDENVYVFAIEHHCNEGLWGRLGTISEDGFTLDSYCEEYVWKDMIVEDLAMIYDYLTTGSW